VALATGVADRVRFMGAADQKTVVETCRMADLFVMPSTGEGFGIAFLEAMASGLPALGLAVGGAPDALGDGELGIAIAEPEVASSIAAALARPKVSSRDLANAVRARFGREAFTASALAANNRLQEPA
jgi:phosphatidyl-myo-inositol dimannoside synthase